MKLLLLATNFQSFTNSTLYYEQQAILDAFPGSVIYGPGFTYETNDVPAILNSYGGEAAFDAIICYAAERQLLGDPISDIAIEKFALPENLWRFPRNLHKVNLPKFCWINDFWHNSSDDWRKVLLGNDFSHILATYAPPFSALSAFSHYFPIDVLERIPCIPWPRAINTARFNDYHEEKIYDVTMLGAQGDFYPVRRKMLDLFIQSNIDVFYKQRPTNTFTNKSNSLTGEKYARVVNKSKIFAGCSGKFRIPFIKMYEPLACKSVLMCNPPHGAQYIGLRPHKTFIPTTGDDCVEVATHYLNNEHLLEEIAERGHNYFLQHHTVETRALELKAMLDKLLNKNEQANWAELSHNWRLVSARKRFDQNNRNAVHDAKSRHILSFGLPLSESTWRLWLKLGVNNRPYSSPPVVTKCPEIGVLRVELLKDLARKTKSKNFVEVGTARGMQSMAWAQMLIEEKVEDGSITTCDVIAHDDRRFFTTLTGDRQYTRRELWDGTAGTQHIRFIHGDSGVLKDHIKAPIDMAYIDGAHTYNDVIMDYENIAGSLHEKSVIIFDDCDERFPGVVDAVNEIVEKNNYSIELVRFDPSKYTVALVNL